MSIDLEEWFQVTNFEKIIDRAQWDRYPSRLPEVMPRLFDILAENSVRATFFVLGWIAERHPQLIRRIQKEGHEVASHGYDHRLVTAMTPAEFKQQLVQSKDILEQILGERVYGYRAPSYSFRNETRWVIDELINAGFLYDSSIFPFGVRNSPHLCDSKYPCILSGTAGDLTEYPLSTAHLFGVNLPIAGGGYFRLLPYEIVHRGIQKLNQDKRPTITYFHPWEFDPGQPRMTSASWLAKFRHYRNLDKNMGKFQRLLKDFRFSSFKDIFWNEKDNKYDIWEKM